MQLLQSWKESLAILLPRNLILFLLVTLKAFIDSTKIWLRNFWWLLGLYLLSDGAALWLYQHVFSSQGDDRFLVWQRYFSLLEYTSLTIAIIMLWTALLTVRPSVKLKNMSYYLEYKWHALWFVVCSILLFYLIKFADYQLLMIEYYKTLGLSAYSPAVDTTISVLLNYILVPFVAFGRLLGASNSLIYAPLFVLFILALLDTRATIGDMFKSKLRMLKMILYTYPLLWIIVWCATSVVSAINYASTLVITKILGASSQFPLIPLFALDTLFFVLLHLCYLLYLCILVNLYTKQTHEQFNRYF